MTFEPPIHWNDYEDIAMKLHERFGDDFTESKIYRLRFTDLHKWVLEMIKLLYTATGKSVDERMRKLNDHGAKLLV